MIAQNTQNAAQYNACEDITLINEDRMGRKNAEMVLQTKEYLYNLHKMNPSIDISNVEITTWSPGDGWTRYQLVRYFYDNKGRRIEHEITCLMNRTAYMNFIHSAIRTLEFAQFGTAPRVWVA